MLRHLVVIFALVAASFQQDLTHYTVNLTADGTDIAGSDYLFVSPEEVEVLSPGPGEHVTAGTTYTIHVNETSATVGWFYLAEVINPTLFRLLPVGQIDGLGDGATFAHYDWHVPGNLSQGSKYVLMPFGMSDYYGISQMFAIDEPRAGGVGGGSGSSSSVKPETTTTPALPPSMLVTSTIKPDSTTRQANQDPSATTRVPTTEPGTPESSDAPAPTTVAPATAVAAGTTNVLVGTGAPTSTSAAVPEPATSSSAPASKSTSSSTVIGAAVGGALGGLVLILVAAVFFLMRRRRRRSSPEALQIPAPYTDAGQGKPELDGLPSPRAELHSPPPHVELDSPPPPSYGDGSKFPSTFNHKAQPSELTGLAIHQTQEPWRGSAPYEGPYELSGRA